VVPPRTADEAAMTRVEDLARSCGAEPVRMTAEDHDAAVALISHAPLVLSAALAEAAGGRAEWPSASRLAAGGWASMTRLATGDPTMGGDILATNAAPTVDALRAVRTALDSWIAAIEDGADPERLRRRLRAAAAAVAGEARR
jgi:prephenate dehydrogenase